MSRELESILSYMQSGLGLCWTASPKMGEEEKLAHLMQGFVENFYSAFLLKDVSSTDKFINTVCKRDKSKND